MAWVDCHEVKIVIEPFPIKSYCRILASRDSR